MISLNPIKYLRFVSRVLTYARRVEGKTELSLLEQGSEVYRLLQLNMLEPREYYETYELFRSDLTWEDKKRFLSRNQFAILCRELDPAEEWGMLNKLVFKYYAQRFGWPVATMYGLFHHQLGYTADGQELRTAADIERLVADPEIVSFVLKPISTDKATGVMVCAKEEGELILLGTGKIRAEELYDKIADTHHNEYKFIADAWLIEKRILQHHWFDRFSNTYTHAYRIVTFLTANGEVELVGASMGIGLQGRYVHQAGPLGLSVGISDDGVLTKAVRIGPQGSEFFESHPDSGARIEGERPPGFAEAVELACRAHKFIPHLRLLGWDIAPSEEGPEIFETNTYLNWEKLQASSRTGMIRKSLAKELPAILAQG